MPEHFISSAYGEDLGWGSTEIEALLMAYSRARHASLRRSIRRSINRLT